MSAPELGPVRRVDPDAAAFANDAYRVRFADGRLELPSGSVGLAVVLESQGEREELVPGGPEVAIADGVLARVVARATSRDGHSLRVTYDVHQTSNLHVYLRLEWGPGGPPDAVELPRLVVDGAAELQTASGSSPLGEHREERLREPWLRLRGEAELGIGVTKLPWKASWNDVGAVDHCTLGDTVLRAGDGAVALRARPLGAAGDTLEASLFLRPGREPAERVRFEATHDDARELRYIPAGEWARFSAREVEDRWLGPPILGGCPARPPDQLIPRSLGMDILANHRFTWNNEDLSLWRITGKELYRDIAVKKAYGLLAAQNRYGGWFEGVEFYDLPPEHHQHYHSYTSFTYLIDAYDVTGEQRFLDAALRCKEYWFGDPPANGHSVDAPDAWWYRWGGYINAAGYTDERHALNTHASPLLVFSLLWTRLDDQDCRRGLDHGVNAFRRALDQGLQKPNGQFLYSLSQIDARLERPGDPPYLQNDLIPEIEDVYTVLSAFRLIVANRVARDPAVAEACARALNYFWQAQRHGPTYTYRSYAVKSFGVAAGELDLRFAFALPELLKDPDNWTSIYRGLSAWVAPWKHKGLLVEAAGSPPDVESVFLSRDADRFRFALVNTGAPRAATEFGVELDEAAGDDPTIDVLDPATGELESSLPVAVHDGTLSFELPRLGEGGLNVIQLNTPR